MRNIRIYHPQTLELNTQLKLDKAASHHLLRVLRIKPGTLIQLFDGKGKEVEGVFADTENSQAMIKITQELNQPRESPLRIHLGQGISRGEKMDFTIQKAVELGVAQITPIFSEFSNVKLDAQRLENRWQHWQGVAISACEQSGRSYLPRINKPLKLAEWLQHRQESLLLVADPKSSQNLSNLEIAENTVAVLIGSEGGLSAEEVGQAHENGFHSLSLGPRILRTETAALAVVVALQCRWGDMGGKPVASQ